jgi:undecaprenyl pyrophosphate synthase
MLFLSLENWKRRAEIVNYCVNVVDQSMEEKRKSLTSEESDARAQRKTQAAMFADEVKVSR